MGLRTIIKVLRNGVKALFKPRIIKTHCPKFFLSPMLWHLWPWLLTELNRRFFTEQTTPPSTNGIEKNLLGNSIPPSCGLPHLNPITCFVTGTREKGWVYKALYQHRTNPVTALPVIGQTRKGQRQDPGGKILYPNVRKNQESTVRNNTMQIGPSSCFTPSNILISILQGPRSRTEGQSPKITIPRTLDHISDLSTTQGSTSKIMISIKKGIPNLGFPRISTTDRRDDELTHLIQRTTNLRNIKLNRINPTRISKTIGFLTLRQIQKTTLSQFYQCLSAIHVFQSSIWRPPIEPFTNPSRKLSLRYRWLFLDSLLNSIQNRFGKILSINIHEPLITSFPLSVECVLRSAPAGERKG
jgi:hypothetical protein